MSRIRSRQQESESVVPRTLKSKAAVKGKIDTYSVRTDVEHWPGNRKVRPGDLTPEVIERIEEAGDTDTSTVPATATFYAEGLTVPSGAPADATFQSRLTSPVRLNLFELDAPFPVVEIPMPWPGTWEARVLRSWELTDTFRGGGSVALSLGGVQVWPLAPESTTAEPTAAYDLPDFDGGATIRVAEAGTPLTVQLGHASSAEQSCDLFLQLALREPEGDGFVVPAGPGLPPMEFGIAVGFRDSSRIWLLEADGSQVFDFSINPTIPSFVPSGIRSIEAIPGGDLLVGWTEGTGSGDSEGVSRVTRTGEHVWTVEYAASGNSRVDTILYDSVTGSAYTLWRGTIHAFDDLGSPTRRELGTFPGTSNVGLGIDRTNSRIIASGGSSGDGRGIFAFDLDATEQPADQLATLSNVGYGVQVSGDGSTVWIYNTKEAGQEVILRAFSTATGEVLAELLDLTFNNSDMPRSPLDADVVFARTAFNAYRKFSLSAMSLTWANTAREVGSGTPVSGIEASGDGGCYFAALDGVVKLDGDGTDMWETSLRPSSGQYPQAIAVLP